MRGIRYLNLASFAYPCYFEKFRTDGVEYDIYIGQSIVPDKPFSDIYLKNLRLMQLTSMAAIAKYTHALLPLLSNPVETTQLIFVHSQPLDILFRNDEKRFDVEVLCDNHKKENEDYFALNNEYASTELKCKRIKIESVSEFKKIAAYYDDYMFGKKNIK